MAITRAKATSLLNKTEMGLFDDSRSNAVRGHSEARLNQLVTRARTARDRARDLEKRQRLASRGTTGSKSGMSGQANARTGEKVELLSDILARFETRQSQAAKTTRTTKTAKSAGTANTGKPATRKTARADHAPAESAAKKAATKKAATKKAATKKAATKKVAAKKVAATNVATKKPSRTRASAVDGVENTATTRAVRKAASAASTKAGRGADKAASGGSARSAKSDSAASPAKPSRRARTGASGITPEKALKNTRNLLKTREQEAKSAKPWETIGADGATEAAPGFQSPRARAKALDLHAAEIRQASIQGSISTRGRKSQGKRDNRNSNDS